MQSFHDGTLIYSYVAAADYLAPARDLAPNEGLEFLGRVAHRFGPLLLDLRAHCRLLHDGPDLRREPFDDRPRCSGRHLDPEPGHRVHGREAGLTRRRHFWQGRAALRSRHGKGAQPPITDVAERGRKIVHRQINATGDDLRQHWTGAPEGYMYEVDPGSLLQQLASEVEAGAIPRAAEGQPFPALLGQGDHFLQCLGG